MSISSVSGNSLWTQMQQFKSGQIKLQKEDLQQMQQQVEQTQTQSASPFGSLLEAFDQIDQNQDGISIDELESYASENGMPEGGDRPPQGPPPGPPPSMMGELRSQQSGGPGKMQKGVSKDELLDIQSQMENQGMEVPDKLSQLISNFDSLDTDQDGTVSIDEMLAAQETESESAISDSENSLEAQKLDFLELIKKYASENSAESSSESTAETNKEMTIKFMQAINQYTSFASYTKQFDTSSLFEINA